MTVRTVHEEMYKTHTTQGPRLGAIAEWPDGSRFRYCKNGAVALLAGVVTQGALPIADHSEMVVSVQAAVGALTVSATMNGTTAATKDQYKDGYLWVNKSTGIGHTYRIKGNTAAAGAAVCTFTLYEHTPVVVAFGAATEVTVLPNKFNGVLVHASPPTAGLVGVTMCAVAANAYHWEQVRGPVGIIASGTLVIGDSCVPSATTDGTVMPSAAFETDGPLVGRVLTVNITAEHALIDVCIE